MHLNLLLNSLRQFCENEFIAHVTEAEHKALGKIGVQVDRDPRAPVGVITRQDRSGIFGAQFEDTVRVALEREQVTACVGLLRLGFGHELAGELPATYPVDHPAPFLMECLACPGV